MKKASTANNKEKLRSRVLIVLDRDGTINYDPGWLGRNKNWRKQIRLLDGVAEGIKKLNSFGKVMVASNQSGVARNYFSLDTVLEINKKIDELLRSRGAVIENWQICPYVDFEWAKKQGFDLKTSWIKKNNLFRKPRIGMIQEGAKEMGVNYEKCFIVSIGNRLADAEMGLNAGGIGIIIRDHNYLKEFAAARDLSKKKKNRIFAVNNFSEAVSVALSNIYEISKTRTN